MGFEKLLKQTDEKIAAKDADLDSRPTTTTEIQKHLDDFGLEQEFGTYGKVRGLSGG
jgi:elongation factor 3